MIPCVVILLMVIAVFSTIAYSSKEDTAREERVYIQNFSQEDMVVIPEVMVYTYEEAITLGTATEYRDVLPGASEGTWYVIEIEGIEYYYGRYDFELWEQPHLVGAAYSIVGENYTLANGLKVGMTEEEVLQQFPNMAVVDFEGNHVYEKVWGHQGWNIGHYPEAGPGEGQDYKWTDQFAYVMLGNVEQEEDALPVFVGLMVKDKVVKAITFHCPTAG